jgi:glutamate/tyrosine decarboxylase-like PLP-dependent enzyme
MSVDTIDTLARVLAHAKSYIDSRSSRPVWPAVSVEDLRLALGSPLHDRGLADTSVIESLIRLAEPGTVATTGPRYFGFVTGGALPAAIAADWLATVWDQNAGLYVMSPAAAVVEEVAGRWLLDVLGLPATASVGFVTGCHMANLTALAAARHELLARAGWNVERDGLAGSPPLRVIVGAEVHVSVVGALRILGFGSDRLIRVAADDQGRMRPETLEEALGGDSGPAIVCAQVGNVNTGAFDPVGELSGVARRDGAWLHVDGAFGLWAAASRTLRHHLRGVERADSWATDAHKWLNVPYDSGLVFVAHPAAHRAAMSLTAEYLVRSPQEPREPMDWTPESSRRARGFAVYAALQSLGRSGIEDLVDRCCRLARRFADRLRQEPSVAILNEVVLNQVLVRVTPRDGDADRATREALRLVQEERVCWLGGTRWHDMDAMRISVSNWSTTEEDIDRSADSIFGAVRRVVADRT